MLVFPAECQDEVADGESGEAAAARPQRDRVGGEAAEIAARPQARGACLCPLGEVERREADPGRTRCVGRRHRWERGRAAGAESRAESGAESAELRAIVRGTQQAAGWRASFGRQATLRGCDGHAHYPLAQRTVSEAQRTVGRAHCPCWE